jgi:hypothetical protein
MNERATQAVIMREDLRHFTQEARRRERGAWTYLWFTGVMIVVIVAAFLWWTW